MEFLQHLDTIRAEEASIHKLFGGEGTGLRSGSTKRKARADYNKKLAAAAQLIESVMTGRKPEHYLKEAMGIADFSYIFADIIDRAMLGTYMAYPSTYKNYVRTRRVRDFRTVKRFTLDGSEAVLGKVLELEAYPASELTDGIFSYAVAKYGRRVPLSWESLINDDLDALSDIPDRLGKAAARSEQKFSTQLFADASGPHASFYTTANKNQVNTTNGASATNPPLSISGLQDAMIVLGAMVDDDDEPIFIETIELVVPPALEVTANNVLNAIQLELNEAGGTSNQKLIAVNWMKNRMRLNVDPYLPVVSSTANGATSWYLFASTGAGRPAMEMGFLRGHETPEIFVKAPNSRRVGGGELNPLDGDFDTDSVEYKVRHVFGGTRMDPKATVASNGSGS